MAVTAVAAVAAAAVIVPAVATARSRDRSVAPVEQDLGVRRELSAHYSELRERVREQRVQLAGPRLEWLKRIVADCDHAALARFVETVRMAGPDKFAEACAWCNKRIVRRVNSGYSGGNDGASLPAKACQICQRWHCEPCCVKEDVAAFLDGVPCARPMKAELDCCGMCQKLLFELRRVTMPSGSARILAAYKELAPRMTTLASALAQLDGLVRVAELHQEQELLLPDELRSTAEASRAQAQRAELDLEAALRALGAVECGGASGPGRDVQLRAALVRHGRIMIEELKPRLQAALTRASLALPRDRPAASISGPASLGGRDND